MYSSRPSVQKGKKKTFGDVCSEVGYSIILVSLMLLCFVRRRYLAFRTKYEAKVRSRKMSKTLLQNHKPSTSPIRSCLQRMKFQAGIDIDQIRPQCLNKASDKALLLMD